MQISLPTKVKEIIRDTNYQHPRPLYHAALKADSILEIGLREGYSTTSFLCGLRDGKQGHLWSIDWGKDPRTPKTADIIQRSEMAEYFTWINRDVRLIPESWFESHSMDIIFPDLNVLPLNGIPLTGLLQNCLLLMHKGSKMFLLGVNRNSEKEMFIANLDRDLYSYEIQPIQSGMAIITKEADG